MECVASGGFLGAVAVEYAEWFLPYSLGFAAGAMIYVVVGTKQQTSLPAIASPH